MMLILRMMRFPVALQVIDVHLYRVRRVLEFLVLVWFCEKKKKGVADDAID